jgi:uncharacterized protein YjiS (DUF1127 family)
MEEKMTATTPSSFFASAFETFARQVRTARARRAQHLALAALMDMDAHQLDDLGLNVGDIVDALNSPPPATPALVARRAQRAAHWTPDTAAAGH